MQQVQIPDVNHDDPASLATLDSADLIPLLKAILLELTLLRAAITETGLDIDGSTL